VNDRAEGYEYPARVRFEMVEKDLDSYRRAADFINFNNVEVLCVQHEFGIYGGPAGSHLLALLKEVRMPIVTTLHTVLRQPNIQQRQVMDEIGHRSDRLVVMAHKGAEFLTEIYGIPRAKIDVIPHGIPDVPFLDAGFYKNQFGVEGKKVLLTFGLLGPAKGIEFVIEALPEIIRQYPDVVYLILGATHPNLLASDGESYRLSLERLAEDRGVTKNVIFYNRYVSDEDLREFIGAADIYITPYLNEAQITSGTLAYVFGAGKAVVSTPYWHAQELLADDRGILVAFRDSSAIAQAVSTFLGSASLLEQTRRQAYQIGRGMIWPAIAKQYLGVFEHARADRRDEPRRAFADWTLESRVPYLPPMRLDHVIRMTDRTGIFQHAVFNVPNFSEGYCTDDNARAYILCNLIDEVAGELPPKHLEKLATIYLAFLWHALPAGEQRFRNFMTHGRDWLPDTGSEDSHARGLWAVGTGVGRSRNEGHRNLCGLIFKRALPIAETFTSPRAWAFTLLAIHEYLRRFAGDSAMNATRALLTERLINAWKNSSDAEWQWFESVVTYDNARISQALILSGRWMPNKEALDIGLASLSWLAKVQRGDSGHFSPIGSNGFLRRGGARAAFDQQPLEASAVVAASLEAFRATQDASWSNQARRAFEWFLGRNDLGISLYDPRTGGCRDGLHPDRANENQGAESTLAFHLSLAEMNSSEHLIAHAGPAE
jgi:glycosyltransferase involved in cell wall biosynthesis